MKKNDIPAFPFQSRTESGEMNSPDFGMTLRDYFAGQALSSGDCPYNSHEHEKRAEWCRQEADAMLAEREKGE